MHCTAHPLRPGYRDMGTAHLIEEAECWGWDLASLEAAAAADPASVNFFPESRDFIHHKLTEINTVLEERRNVRGSVWAPKWPTNRTSRKIELELIKQGVDLVEFVQRVTPTRLRRAGRQWVGLCPFHQERTPSFYVDQAKGLWHCKGACQRGGDIFTFAMLVFNITEFRDAVTFLSPIAGAGGHNG